MQFLAKSPYLYFLKGKRQNNLNFVTKFPGKISKKLLEKQKEGLCALYW